MEWHNSFFNSLLHHITTPLPSPHLSLFSVFPEHFRREFLMNILTDRVIYIHARIAWTINGDLLIDSLNSWYLSKIWKLFRSIQNCLIYAQYRIQFLFQFRSRIIYPAFIDLIDVASCVWCYSLSENSIIQSIYFKTSKENIKTKFEDQASYKMYEAIKIILISWLCEISVEGVNWVWKSMLRSADVLYFLLTLILYCFWMLAWYEVNITFFM